MSNITSYESFCKILQNGQGLERKQARLLLWLQNWIIQAMSCKKDHQFDNHLEGLLNAKSSKAETKLEIDVLGKILNESLKSMKHIMEDNMRSRIIRENVVMPVHKVREINGYTMSWISRKSGKTIYDKIASANNSIMAVQKRPTYDTLENRLFMTFLRELAEHLYTKLDIITDDNLCNIIVHRGDEKRSGDDEVLVEISNFLNDPEYDEVKRWNNLPPNNTLLSERNYNQIWRAWGELKRLDERFEQDMDGLYKHVANIFLVEILAYIKDSKSIRLPQEPIEVDYEGYTVSGENVKFEALYKDDQYFKISKQEDIDHNKVTRVYLNLGDTCLSIEFTNTSIGIYENSVEIFTKDLSLESLKWTVQYSVNYFGFIYLEKAYLSAAKVDHIILDIFSLYPQFMDGNECIPLTNRLLYQSYKMKNHLGEEETYQIPCDKSSAIKMIDDVTETYSMVKAIQNGSFNATRNLLALFDNEIEALSCHFIVPDIYDEFLLSKTLNVAGKLQYGQIQKTPVSIAVAFQYQESQDFNVFDVGKEMLVVIDLLNDTLVFTLLNTSIDQQLAEQLPYHGVVWERHPRKTYSVTDTIDTFISKLKDKGYNIDQRIYQTFGLEGLLADAGNLSIYFGDENWLSISDEIGELVKNMKIDIHRHIEQFIQDFQGRIGDKKITFVSLVEQLNYEGPLPFIKMTRKDVLSGCKLFEDAEKILTEKNIKSTLWRDFLEPLAIKRLVGQFDLIKEGQAITPIVGGETHIKIPETFQLKKGVSRYEFDLLKGDGSTISRYSAIIQNDVVVEKDIICRLKLTYRYGAEQPYELIFEPIQESDQRYFKARKVKWEETDYKKDTLPQLPFPQKMEWNQLEYYWDKRGFPINVCDILAEEYFLPLAWGVERIGVGNLSEWIGNNSVVKKEGRYIDTSALRRWYALQRVHGPQYISVTYDVWTNRKKDFKRMYQIKDVAYGDTVDRRIDKYTNSYHTKWLFTLFLGNRQISDGAPSNLQEVFNRAKDSWLNLYDETDKGTEKRSIVRRLSLAGKQLGSQYFNIVQDYLERYKEDNLQSSFLPYKCISELGCGLSDLSTLEEQEMLESIFRIVEEENVVGILAKALWHNELLLEKIDSNLLINTYLPVAVKFISKCTKKESYKNKAYNPKKVSCNENGNFSNHPWNPYIERRMGACFEFIAALLRLKNRGDELLNESLSLRNPYLRQLVKDTETLYRNKFDFHTYLDFPEGTNIKGQYDDMNTVMFLILAYITGYNSQTDIEIQGIKFAYDYDKIS